MARLTWPPFFIYFMFFSVFLLVSNLCHCQHQYPSLTFDVFLRGRCSMEMWCPGGMAGVGLGHLMGESTINSPEWGGGSSRRKRIVAKENGALPDWIVVVSDDG